MRCWREASQLGARVVRCDSVAMQRSAIQKWGWGRPSEPTAVYETMNVKKSSFTKCLATASVSDKLTSAEYASWAMCCQFQESSDRISLAA